MNVEHSLHENEKGLFASEKLIYDKYLLKGGLCLDVGCATGRTLFPLLKENIKVVGVDLSHQMLAAAKGISAKKEAKLPLAVGDFRYLMFKDKSFDTVILHDIIQFFPEQKDRFAALREIQRILKNNGTLILCSLNNDVLFDFPYSFRPFIKSIGRRIEKISAIKRNPKSRDFFLLTLNAASISVPGFFIDGMRSFLMEIFGKHYQGPLPRQRIIRKTIHPEAYRGLPYYLYRRDDIKKEIENSGLTLIDEQSDWEIVFCDELPFFFKRLAPVTYYVARKETAEQKKEKVFSEVIPILKDEILKGRTQRFHIISHSMWPVLSVGDKLYAKRAPFHDLHIGDIIIFESRNRLIAHRIIGIKQSSSALTKGDNSKEIDESVDKGSFLAKISYMEIGRFRVNFESPFAKIANWLLARTSLLETGGYKGKFGKPAAKLFRMLALIFFPILIFLPRIRIKAAALEKELIIQLCSRPVDDEKKYMVEQLISRCRHWNRFLSLALYNNIGPILYRNLSQITTHQIPSWVTDALKESYKQGSIKTAPLYRDLSVLLKDFKENNIAVIVLKGAAIAEELYKDTGLRPMEDIDLLIKKSDWPRVKDVLEKQGYQNPQGLDPLELELHSKIIIDRHVFYRNSSGTKIEFKFMLFPLVFPYFPEKENYWKNAILQKIAGVDTLVLSPEDQFLYLASRLINVGFRNFLWFYDLKEFLYHHQTINWKYIIDTAIKKKISPILYYALQILKEEFLAEVIEDGILLKLQPSRLRRKCLEVLFDYRATGFRNAGKQHLFPDPILTNCLLLGKFDFTLKGTMRMLRYGFKTIFPPIDYICYRYKISRWQAYLGVGYWLRVRTLLLKTLRLKVI